MTITTSVPAIEWVNGSPLVPTETAIWEGVKADLNAAFGGGCDLAEDSPLGKQAAVMAQWLAVCNAQIAYLAAQWSPAHAEGVMQAAIGELYGVARLEAAGTVVDVTLTGLVGAVAPAGMLLRDTSGYTYALTASATIGTGGTASAQAQNTTPGPIPCAAGALSIIYVRAPGIDAVTNAAVGALGRLVETRASFEARRKAEVAAAGMGGVLAIAAAVRKVPGVVDVLGVENNTASPISWGITGYTIPAHGICISVAGGDETAIAEAMMSKRYSVAMAGNKTVTVYDTANYSPPYPAYTNTFLIPTPKNVFFAVTAKDDPTLPATAGDDIKAAIVAAFAGEDGGERCRIGGQTYSGRFVAAISAAAPLIRVTSVYMGFSAGSVGDVDLEFGINELPVLDPANIAVVFTP